MKEDKSIDIDDVAGLASGIHFVSGIDTDAGKTVCTGWLARELMHAGRTVATMKLVQTGCGAFSPDIRVHRRIMGVHLTEDDSLLTAPALFSDPASPHLAAEIDGARIDFKHLSECAETLAARYDVVLVEGAGGLAVPLTRELLSIDFVCQQGWPLVFVTCGRLGAINHTLLSLEAVRNREVLLSAVIFNRCNPVYDRVIDEDTRHYVHDFCRKVHPETLWFECPILSQQELL